MGAAADSDVLRRTAGVQAAVLYSRATTTLADLSAKLNQLTGYNEIELLKAKVDEADADLAAARERLRSSKALYESKQEDYGEVQRQLMALLQRKGSWGRADVEQFSQLCRDEHSLEGEMAEAKAAYGAATQALEGAHAQLLRAIRERYSCETLWSDKIRRASTWWTAGLMGLHLLSFLSMYLIMEPIKARRLRNHVEDVLRQELERVRQDVSRLQVVLQAQPASEPSEAASPAGAGPLATADVAATRALLAEVQSIQRQLTGVEKRVAEVGGGLALQTAAVTSLASAVSGQDGFKREVTGPKRASQEEVSQLAAGLRHVNAGEAGEAALGDVGSVSEAQVKRVPGLRGRFVEWRGWAVQRLRHISSIPEITTGAAAFAGAVLGGAILLLLRDRR